MSYNSITLHDKQKVNYMLVTKRVASPTDITTANATDFNPTWATYEDPHILCPYVDNLVSSYITGLISPITAFIIYRQKIGESRLYKVAEVDKDTLSIVDYLIANNTEYQWFVMPLTEGELGISMASRTMSASWEGISLSSLNEVSKGVFMPDETWIFQEDISYGSMSQNIDRTVNKTYSKYPKISVGTSSFQSGNISCRLSKIYCTGEYDSSTELYSKWMKFVESGKPFLFKDMKGLMFMAQISDNTSMQYIDGYVQGMTDNVPQYHQISFSYTEIGNTEGITIYEPVEGE